MKSAALHRQQPRPAPPPGPSACRQRSSRASRSGGLRRRTCARSGKARCPSASNLRAVCASAGVSALARTPMSRTASAQLQKRAERRHPAPGRSISAAPASTSPVVPSIVMTSPSRKTRPSGVTSVLSRVFSRMSDAPDDARQPKPARDHRRVAGHAAAFGQNTRRRHACRGYPRAWFRGAPGSQGSPASALACAADGEKTILPVGAPGLAAMPRAMTSRGPRGSTWWCRSSDRARGSTRKIASSFGDDPILGQRHRDPHRRAGRSVTRDRIEHRQRPFSMVNSICISSRSLARQIAPCST